MSRSLERAESVRNLCDATRNVGIASSIRHRESAVPTFELIHILRRTVDGFDRLPAFRAKCYPDGFRSSNHTRERARLAHDHRSGPVNSGGREPLFPGTFWTCRDCTPRWGPEAWTCGLRGRKVGGRSTFRSDAALSEPGVDTAGTGEARTPTHRNTHDGLERLQDLVGSPPCVARVPGRPSGRAAGSVALRWRRRHSGMAKGRGSRASPRRKATMIWDRGVTERQSESRAHVRDARWGPLSRGVTHAYQLLSRPRMRIRSPR